MCGICGVVDLDRSPDPAIVTGMLARLRHRGPDGSGYMRERSAVLGPVVRGGSDHGMPPMRCGMLAPSSRRSRAMALRLRLAYSAARGFAARRRTRWRRR